MNPFDASSSVSANSSHLSTAANSCMVNRTHRIIRARASVIKARRRRARSLWVPLVVSSAMLMLLLYAVWSLFDEYEIHPTGIPDASNQLFLFVLWFLPITVGVLGAIWYKRGHQQQNPEDAVR